MMSKLFSALVLAVFAVPAFAVDPILNVPEPGSLALVGIGAVAAVVVMLRNRRK